MQASDGTRWTNEQLLFHMLFGYLIARALLVLAHLFARPPAGVSKRFAWLLDSVTGPFDVVNYYGSCAGARIVGRQRMDAQFDRVIASLHRRLAAETDAHLRRGMHYPVRWDPFFKEFMTLADIYHYPTLRLPPTAAHTRWRWLIATVNRHHRPPSRHPRATGSRLT